MSQFTVTASCNGQVVEVFTAREYTAQDQAADAVFSDACKAKERGDRVAAAHLFRAYRHCRRDWD